jgi:hypothetical protein
VAALSDDLTAHDAVVFLIGGNLGAAAYEAALGIAVRLGLRRAAGAPLAPQLRTG